MASVPLAIRFDSGQVLNPHRTDDGILLCDAIFARDGVLEYRSPGGKKRREFRPPEENQKAIAEFGLASLTLEHPTGLVDESNGDRLRKGISLQTPRYVVVPGKGGFVTGQIAVMSRDAQDAVRRGDASEISAGYKCRIEETPGVWFNPATGQSERYDAIQRDIKVNHIALTRLGRAGPSVKVLGRFDSADLEDNDLAYQVDAAPEPPYSNLFNQEEPMSTNGYTPLATLNLPGGSVQVPQEVFNMISPLLARNDSAVNNLEAELEEAEDRADSAEAALADVQGQVQYKDGMIEALRDRLDQAESLLEDADIAWHEDSYVRLDGKGKKKGKMPEFLEDMEDDEEYVEDMDDEDYDDEDMDDMDDMDDEDMEEDEEEMPAPAKKSKKSKSTKKDSIRTDAVEMVKVIREAEAIGVDFSDLRMDSIDDAADIRRFVVEQKRPNLYRDDASDPYIQALYDAIIDDAMGHRSAPNHRADSGYADELSLVLGTATSGRVMDAGAADRERRMNNFSAPLTANKDNYGKRR